MSREQRPPTRQSFLVATARGAFAALLIVGLVALPAWSARVVDVRVGQHPEFTRVVFELDQSAGYKVDRTTEKGVLRVSLSASARAESIDAGGQVVKSVIVQQGVDGAIARIVLKGNALRVQEMILAKPPRIVLDVMKPVAASKPATTAPIAKVPEAKPTPKPVAKTPEAKPTPKPVAKTPEAKPAPKPVAKTPEAKPAPKPVVEAPKPIVGVPDPESMIDSPGSKPQLPPSLQPRPQPDSAAAGTSPDTSASPSAVPPAEATGEGGGLLENPMVLGAVTVVLVGAIAFFLMRRRKDDDSALDADSDVFTPMGPESPFAEAESGGSTRIPAGGFSMEHGTEEEQEVDSPFATPVSPASTSAATVTSIFDAEPDSSTGDEPMNQEVTDLPADPATIAAAPAADAGGDVARLVQELERRMGALEGKLEEAHEAREKLERQVAAQSEELRVQRAAIARTQRALRSMSRGGGGSGGGEDKATEPALRDDTQARTRVSV